MTEPSGGESRRRYDASQGPRIIGPRDGKAVDLGAVGVRFMVWGEESGGGFSLVEHPIRPRHLASPVHRHSREDEYSFVLEGRLGAQLGDEEVYADVGDLVFKPRDQWHAFWNAGESPCRILGRSSRPPASSTSSTTPPEGDRARTTAPATGWKSIWPAPSA
jgi:mannose-6-phosphate isomerase-like protein (cupin superfamily)